MDKELRINLKEDPVNIEISQKIDTENVVIEDTNKIIRYEEYDNTELRDRIEVLEKENKLFNEQIPIGQATGGYIHLKDSSNMQFINFKVSEKNVQEKPNLFNDNRQFPFTQNGITVSKNEDGSVTLNGTCTVNGSGFNLTFNTGYTVDFQKSLDDKMLALKLVTKGIGKLVNFGLKYTGNADRVTITNIVDENTYKKIAIYKKIKTDTDLLYWSCFINNGVEFIDFTIYPTMVEGEEYKDWIPQNKDIPTDYSENFNIVVSNKNILNFKKEDWDGLYFEGNGTENHYYNTTQSLTDLKYYPCCEGITMYLSLIPICDINIERGQIAWYNKFREPISAQTVFHDKKYSANEDVRIRIIPPINARYFRINFRWVSKKIDEKYVRLNMKEEFWDCIKNLMIEENTQPTGYIQHEEQVYNSLNIKDVKGYKGETIIYSLDAVNNEFEVVYKKDLETLLNK